MDVKFFFSMLIAVVGFASTMALAGAFIWRSHLKAVASEWQLIAQAKAERVTTLESQITNLEADIAALKKQNEEIIVINNALLSQLAQYAATRPSRTRSRTTTTTTKSKE